MKRKHLLFPTFLLCLTCLLFNTAYSVEGQIQSPQTFIGHTVGADYKVARYEKIREYFQNVGKNSRRVNVREIGLTTEGREMVIAEITHDAAPEQIRQAMADQKKIADPRLIKDQEHEQNLISNAKVVVLINCNLHSTELASSQMAMELLYDLATGASPEIQEILKRTLIVLIPSANPDGLNKVTLH
jgi:murein tripeptide amidase MpaA